MKKRRRLCLSFPARALEIVRHKRVTKRSSYHFKRWFMNEQVVLYDISRVLLSLCIYIFTTFIHMVLPRLCAKRQKSSSSPLFLVSYYISIIRVPGTILLLLVVIVVIISLFLQINSIFRWVFLPHLFQIPVNAWRDTSLLQLCGRRSRQGLQKCSLF